MQQHKTHTINENNWRSLNKQSEKERNLFSSCNFKIQESQFVINRKKIRKKSFYTLKMNEGVGFFILLKKTEEAIYIHKILSRNCDG